MKRLANRDPFKVGLVAIAVGLVAVLGVVGLSLMSFGTKGYTAILEQTAGLRAGEDVSVHGVPSGKVKSIELAGDKVKVHFVLDKDLPLGSATTAEVKVATLLGTHYLEVDPQGGGSLANDTIPIAQTSVPFNLQDVLEQGTASLEKLDANTLAKALTEVSKTMTASSTNLGPALEGVTALSDAVSTRQAQTTQLLRAARSVTDQLSDSSADIVVLMKQANLVLAEINRRRDAIHALLVETTTLSRNLSAITDATRADLGPAFEKLNQVLSILRKEDKALSSMVKVAAPAVRYVANATGKGPWGVLWGKSPLLPPDDLCKRLGNLPCS